MTREWHICWVVALAAEARVLLNSYRFTRIQDHPFPLYHSKKDSMHLVISGIGKVRSAAATAWLGSQAPPYSIWINLGIAGHKDASLGKGYWVHKIRDGESHYYPLVLAYWESSSIVCHDQVQQQPSGLVDMESSGFYPTAVLFTYRELVQLYKIVSDNEEESPQKHSAESIEQLFAPSRQTFAAALGDLRQLAKTRLDEGRVLHEQLEEWTNLLHKQYHFSASHRARLQEVLRRWYIMKKTSPLDYPAEDAAALLEKLARQLSL